MRERLMIVAADLDDLIRSILRMNPLTGCDFVCFLLLVYGNFKTSKS